MQAPAPASETVATFANVAELYCLLSRRLEHIVRHDVRVPEAIVEDAITGMLPHTKMGRAMASKLKVYRGDKHPHQAQKPEQMALA